MWKKYAIKSLLMQCGWMSVAQLSVYHSLLLMFIILSTKSPVSLYSKLLGVQENNYYTTRFVTVQIQNQNIKLDSESQAECDIARRSFKYRAKTFPFYIVPFLYTETRKKESLFYISS